MKTLLLLAAALLFLTGCEGLKCHECTYPIDDKCGDPFSPEPRQALSEKDCGENYMCVKTALKSKLVNTYGRACTIKLPGMEDGCTTTTVAEVETINCFCSSNLCNGGDAHIPLFLLSVLPAVGFGVLQLIK